MSRKRKSGKQKRQKYQSKRTSKRTSKNPSELNNIIFFKRLGIYIRFIAKNPSNIKTVKISGGVKKDGREKLSMSEKSSVVSRQLSAGRYQASVVSRQLSAGRYQASVISCQSSAGSLRECARRDFRGV